MSQPLVDECADTHLTYRLAMVVHAKKERVPSLLLGSGWGWLLHAESGRTGISQSVWVYNESEPPMHASWKVRCDKSEFLHTVYIHNYTAGALPCHTVSAVSPSGCPSNCITPVRI